MPKPTTTNFFRGTTAMLSVMGKRRLRRCVSRTYVTQLVSLRGNVRSRTNAVSPLWCRLDAEVGMRKAQGIWVSLDTILEEKQEKR